MTRQTNPGALPASSYQPNNSLMTSPPTESPPDCAWCLVEERGRVPSVPGCEHINGAYEADHLCAECFDWLQNGPPTLDQLFESTQNS